MFSREKLRMKSHTLRTVIDTCVWTMCESYTALISLNELNLYLTLAKIECHFYKADTLIHRTLLAQ